MSTETLFTASDVARFCQVDLKTIHNWADRGMITHFRTPGRHLRFKAPDVRDFLARQGFPIPAIVEADAATASGRTLLTIEGATVTYVSIGPGDRRPEEIHVAQRKTIVTLVGVVHVRTGPMAQEVCGVVALVEAGMAHTIENRSQTERAEYLAILRPGAP